MRLVNDDRDTILEKVVETTFREREKALMETQLELAVKLRNSLLTPEQIKAVDSLPRKFFGKNGRNMYNNTFGELFAGYAYFQKGGEAKEYHEVHFGVDLNVPSYILGSTHIVEDQALLEELTAWTEAKRELEAERKDFRAQTKGVLAAFTTVEKLLEAWPTLREVMGDDFFIPASRAQLPVAAVNALDDKLQAALKVAA